MLANENNIEKTTVLIVLQNHALCSEQIRTILEHILRYTHIK